MSSFEGAPKGDYHYEEDNRADWDPMFCHAYGQCDNGCLLFGCAFEETEDARNWEPENPDTDKD